MPIDLGDPWPNLSVQVRNASQVLENATSVALTITKPDGSTVSPSVTNSSPGIYTASYTPDGVGRYTARWVATGTNASAYTDICDVRPAASTNLLSLADAKLTLNIDATDSSQDEELRAYIEATTDLIESLIGPVVVRTVTEQLRGRGTFVLSQTPVVSLTSISGVLTGALAFDVSQLDVDSTTGVVRRIDRGVFGDDLYDLTYTAGRPGVIPARITQAARVLLAHLWRTQRGVSGGRTRGDDGTNDFPAGYSIPNRVLELLASDLIAPGIA